MTLYDPQAIELDIPTPIQIEAIRIESGLTQQQAAELVHRKNSARWREWSGGKYAIDMAVWELFLIKTGFRTPLVDSDNARDI